jgi:transcriptional regulator with XRE-family HTH domain
LAGTRYPDHREAKKEETRSMKIKLKELALAKNEWSLYRLAKEMGLPQQTVYSWASGRTQPSYENMDRLCEVLQCSVGELFEAEPVQQKLSLF